MLIKLLLALIGLASGFGVSCGIFAFIMSLGIVERLSAVTSTNKYAKLYESVILCGAISGNILSIFKPAIPLGLFGSGFLGLFAGVFTGILSIALVETLKSIPIMFRRANIHKGLGTVILCIALGKMCGSLLQFAKGWLPK